MLQGIDGVDAFPPVKAEKTFEEIQSSRSHSWTETLVDVALLWLPFPGSFTAREFRPAWHGGLVGRAEQAKNAHALIDVGLAFENGLSLEHFGKDASAQR